MMLGNGPAQSRVQRGLSPHSTPTTTLPAPAHPRAAVRQARRQGEQVALALQRLLQFLNVLPAEKSEGQWISCHGHG